jgi:hypothetical protein
VVKDRAGRAIGRQCRTLDVRELLAWAQIGLRHATPRSARFLARVTSASYLPNLRAAPLQTSVAPFINCRYCLPPLSVSIAPVVRQTLAEAPPDRWEGVRSNLFEQLRSSHVKSPGPLR